MSTTTPDPNASLPPSAAKLVPSSPDSEIVIRDLPGTSITTVSTPFHRFGIVKIGGRATIVKLKTGNLAVFNPVALTDSVREKITSLCTSPSSSTTTNSSQPGAQSGQVAYLIAPDYEHHIYLTPWSQAYPNAHIIGPDGLPEKREKDSSTTGLKFSTVFTPQNKLTTRISEEFDAEFVYEYVHSHQNKELVFLHRPSSTLIEADLLFNLPATEQFSKSGQAATDGLLTKVFASVMNTRGDMKWQKRMLWYGVGAKDRKGFAESARRMHAWGDFERIVPAHGDVIEQGGSRILAQCTAWFREMK